MKDDPKVFNVEIDSSTNSFIADVLENPEKDEENDEKKEFVENDTMHKFQFNYNSSTCFGDNIPEVSAESNIEKTLHFLLTIKLNMNMKFQVM